MRRLAFALAIALLAACNRPPSSPGVGISPPEPTTLDGLSAVTPTPSEDPDDDPVSYSYAWSVDGGAFGNERDVPAEATSKGQKWTLTVTPSDGNKDGEPGRATVTIANAPPSLVDAGFASSTPRVTEDIEAVAVGEDPDGDPVSFLYAWTVDGLETDFVEAVLPASATTRGESWTVTITPFDGEDGGEPESFTAVVENSAPAILSLTLSPDDAGTEATVFRVEAEVEDPDGDAWELTVLWSVNGEVVREGPAALTGSLFSKGDQVTAAAYATDSFGLQGETVEVGFEVPVLNSVPSIDGVTLAPSEIYEASTVTCTPTGHADADPLDHPAYRYAWYVDEGAVGTAATLDGQSFDKGQSLRCEATPFDAESEGESVSSASVEVLNTAPVISSASLSTTAPTERDTLTVNVSGAQDDDGDSISYTYDWLVEGSSVAQSATLDGASFDRGDTLYVAVTPTDGEDDGSPVNSDVATVENALPQVDSLALSPSSPTTTDALNAVVSASDPDGDTVSLAYAWTIEGVADSTSGNTLAAKLTSKHQSIGVTATPSDNAGDGSSLAASPVTVINTAPVFTKIELSPSSGVTVQDTVTCLASGWKDDDDDTEGYTWVWTVGTSTVGSGQTLSAAGLSKGDDVVCTATAWDGEDAGNSKSSSALTLENSAPSITGVNIGPASPGEGDTLSVAVTGTSDPDGDTVSFRYQWFVDGSASEKTSTLTGDDFDKGQEVQVRVTPTDANDDGTPVDSNTLTIANTPPVISSVTLSPSSPKTADTVAASVSWSDADNDSVSFSYAWTANGSALTTTTTGSLDPSYTSKGDSISVTVTPDDSEDSGTAVAASAAVTVVNTAPTDPVVEMDPDFPIADLHDLVCAVSTASSDADGDTMSHSFSWERDGASWTGSTSSTGYSGDTIDASDLSGGEDWVCELTVTDSAGATSATVSASTEVLDACLGEITWTGTDYAGGTDSRGVTVFDVDGDGNADATWCNTSDKDMQVYFGDGTGSFSGYNSFSLGEVSTCVAFGDIDDDGDVDAVSPDADGDLLHFLDGSGGGSFGSLTNSSQAGGPEWVELIDVSGDGVVDVVVSLADTGCIARRVNDGSGTFGSSSCVKSVTGRPVGGDLDNDGYNEVVVVVGGQVKIYEFSMTSGATVTSETTLTTGVIGTATDVDVYDVDGDGDDDLVVFGTYSSDGTDAVVTYLNYEDDLSAFSECLVGSSLDDPGLAAGDFDDDGVPDFATASSCSGCSSTYTLYVAD